jgi:hypothetical protein
VAEVRHEMDVSTAAPTEAEAEGEAVHACPDAAAGPGAT